MGGQNQDYADEPGGAERFNDHDKMVEMLVEANKEDLSVHVHSGSFRTEEFPLSANNPSENCAGKLPWTLLRITAFTRLITTRKVPKGTKTAKSDPFSILMKPVMVWIHGGAFEAYTNGAEKKLAESFCNDMTGKDWERNSRLFSQIWFNAPIIKLARPNHRCRFLSADTEEQISRLYAELDLAQ